MLALYLEARVAFPDPDPILTLIQALFFFRNCKHGFLGGYQLVNKHSNWAYLFSATIHMVQHVLTRSICPLQCQSSRGCACFFLEAVQHVEYPDLGAIPTSLYVVILVVAFPGVPSPPGWALGGTVWLEDVGLRSAGSTLEIDRFFISHYRIMGRVGIFTYMNTIKTQPNVGIYIYIIYQSHGSYGYQLVQDAHGM